jgi:GYF domain 2
MNKPKWYYFNGNNETIGPFSKAVLVELSHAGQINNETPVFQEGTEAWQPFGAAFTQPPEPEDLPPEPEPLPPEPSPSPVAASAPTYTTARQNRDAKNDGSGYFNNLVIIFVIGLVLLLIQRPIEQEMKKKVAKIDEEQLEVQAKRDRENEELRKEKNREMMRRYIRAFPEGR